MRRYIGIDLHKNSFTACIRQENGDEVMQTWTLRKGDMKRFVATLEAEDEMAMEAARNSTWLCRQTEAHVARVAVIGPSRLEVIRRSEKNTDKQAARRIALLLSGGLLPEANHKSQTQAQIHRLIALRVRLVKHHASMLNKMHALFVRHGVRIKRETLTSRRGLERAVASREWSPVEQVEIDAISSQLESVRKTCRTLEREIENAAKTLPGYDCLTSIRGIGTLSATLLLCTIGNIERFAKPGSLAAYFGITPRSSQSNGSRHVGQISKRGDRLARTTLVRCTLIAKRHSPYLQEFYERIKARRGAGKAIIATARTFLNVIFYTLKYGWVFEDFAAFRKSGS